MFSEKEFNKYIERVEEARESFKEAMKNQDYVAARSFVNKQFYLIHDMRQSGKAPTENLTSSPSSTRMATPTSTKTGFTLKLST